MAQNLLADRGYDTDAIIEQAKKTEKYRESTTGVFIASFLAAVHIRCISLWLKIS